MDDLVDYVAKSAPFLANNWPYVLGGWIVVLLLAVFLSYYVRVFNSLLIGN